MINKNDIFPNPVIGAAEINFSIGQPSTVNLSVYDITGRLIRIFIDNRYLVPNIYKIIWYTNDNLNCRLSSGIYFVKLNAGDFYAVKKILVLRKWFF